MQKLHLRKIGRHSTKATNTLWIDSVEVIGNDSTFYLNGVVLSCDTCQFNSGNFPNYKLNNQGQFLQKRMIKKPTSDFVFKGNHNFLLRPNALLGATWLADTLHNIFAEVISQNEQEVFGFLDSVKTIQLSNGTEILISKNYGFLSFPDFGNDAEYNLVGIEGRNLGELVPDMFDFYDFEVGDVFQYRTHSVNCFPCYYYDALWKETILSKFIYPDSIVYDIEKVGNGYTNVVECKKVIIYDSLHPTNYYNLQARYIDDEIDIYDIFDGVSLLKDSEEIVTKIFGTHQLLNGDNYNWTNYYSPQGEDLAQESSILSHAEFNIYKVGLGEIRNRYSRFEYFSSFELEGYVKNGDTIGLVYSDINVINSVHQQDNFPFDIILSPNPASDYFQINFSKPINEILSLQIFSLDGGLILQKEIQQDNSVLEINVNTLLQGVYFVKINGEKIHDIKRLIIQK